MRERITSHEAPKEERPIGRFLLDIEDTVSEEDPYEYARQFVRRPGNFEKYKHKSIKVGTANMDGHIVDVEFKIDRFEYVWKVSASGEEYGIDHISRGSIPLGGEIYELHCAEKGTSGSYAELNVQRSVIRSKEFESEKNLQLLQGLIESIVDGREPSLYQVDEHARTIGQHLLVRLSEGPDDLAAQGSELAVHPDGNLVGEVAVGADDGD
jgi:hypothetical protein